MAFVYFSFSLFPSEAIEEPKAILVTATSLIARSFDNVVLHQELFKTCFVAKLNWCCFVYSIFRNSFKAHHRWLWLDGMQQKPEANNKHNFVPIRLCFINIYTYPTPTSTQS